MAQTEPENLHEKLARIGNEAEAAEANQAEKPIPSHINVSRLGRAHSHVLQIRLNPHELQALEQIAADRDLPVTTIAREQLLRYIDEQNH